jgi:hypothetical protein
MPTREEIVKALRHISNDKNMEKTYGDGVTQKRMVLCDATDLIERQAKEIERLKHDRDAAIADLYKAKSCNTCAKQYKDDCLLEECMEPCSAFAEGSVPYKWRGVEEEPHAD